MSNKHTLLYSKARHVLNQRHMKRPWFNINPFLERVDESVDLDKFVPETDTLQPHESLVLCEKYNIEIPVLTQQMDRDCFFSYLYSDEWRDGSSLRVIEGKLLEELLHEIYVLEVTGKIVSHSTYAFAKNKRIRTGCCKNPDSEVQDILEDIVLLEFTYYGHLTKSRPNTATTNPLQYLHLSRPRPQEATASESLEKDSVQELPNQPSLPTQDSGELLSQEPAASSWSSKESAQEEDLQNFNPGFKYRRQSTIAEEDLINFNPGFKYKRKHSFSQPINVIRAIQGMAPSGRRQSLPVSSLTMPPAFRQQQDSKRKDSLFYQRRRRLYSMDNDRELDELHNKWTKFQLKGIVDSGESSDVDKDELEVEEEKTEIKENQYFGDELYLSDGNTPSFRPGETVLKKLRRRKKELEEANQEQKRQRDERLARFNNTRLQRPSPLLDTNLYQQPSFSAGNWNSPVEVPTFEEFLRVMQEDSHYDPRFKKRSKHRTKKFAKHLRKSLLEPVVEGQSKVDLSHDAERTRSLSLKQSKASSIVGSFESRKATNQRSSVFKRKSQLFKISSSRQHLANEVLGVTDSNSCKEHYLRHKGSKTKEQKREVSDLHKKDGKILQSRQHDLKPFQPTPDIYVISPSGILECLHSGSSKSGSKATSSPLFPKASVSSSIAIESPDDDEEEEEKEEEGKDGDDTSSFDSSKLNINYSFERLRRKRRKMKKKPKFFDVLKKYYKMQAALSVFRKLAPEREQNAAQVHFFGKTRRPRDDPAKDQEPVIGVMKKFDFLNSKRKRIVDIDRMPSADFSAPSPGDLQTKLYTAIEDFVMRREIVVSEKTSKCSTSLTFSLKSSFKAYRQ